MTSTSFLDTWYHWKNYGITEEWTDKLGIWNSILALRWDLKIYALEKLSYIALLKKIQADVILVNKEKKIARFYVGEIESNEPEQNYTQSVSYCAGLSTAEEFFVFQLNCLGSLIVWQDNSDKKYDTSSTKTGTIMNQKNCFMLQRVQKGLWITDNSI